MHFIEIDCKERLGEWSMSSLQSHKYFELYFLLEGTRRFFLNNKIFNKSFLNNSLHMFKNINHLLIKREEKELIIK